MNARFRLGFLCALFALLAGGLAAKPNVLLIVSDDQGWPDLGVMKLKDIVDSLESAIDAFEHVANTVEQIAVKES